MFNVQVRCGETPGTPRGTEPGHGLLFLQQRGHRREDTAHPPPPTEDTHCRLGSLIYDLICQLLHNYPRYVAFIRNYKF